MTTDPRLALRSGSAWRPVAFAAAISLGAIGAIAAPRLGQPAVLGAIAGALAAILAVLALPSIPTRRATIILLGIGGVGALRHASLPGGSSSSLLMLWALATVFALVLADRAAAEMTPAVDGTAPLPRRLPEAVRSAITIAVLVAIVAVILVPPVTQRLGRHVWPGLTPPFGAGANATSSLRGEDRLDMTSRPRLSDRVVFTVDADKAQFWRGSVFDVWDGSAWTRSEPRLSALPRFGLTAQIMVDPFDDGARTGTMSRQTFHIATSYSEVVFAAPSPVTVETDKVLVGRRDGTAGVVGGYGKGAVYTVYSRSALPTETDLQAADATPVPQAVLDRFARPPETSARVGELARRIAADAPTTYDKIRAFEAWLGANTKYSLDAPLSPRGVDVVDHFLFTSPLGWCEQVASSLVVMARSAGIPARLATGFVPGSRDALTGQFVVRERDAHAWTEVYFPGIGWQAFDPTASVPLAGEAATHRSWLDAARRNALAFGLAAAALVLLVGATPELFARWRRRRRVLREGGWAALMLIRLERIGRRAGRARAPAETPREYADALARWLDMPALAEVGSTLDQEAFAAGGAPASRRDAVAAVLEEARVRARPARRANARAARGRRGILAPTVKGIPRGPYGGAPDARASRAGTAAPRPRC